MSRWRASDLVVVIPTRNRWSILGRTLDSLAAQSVIGFDTMVVVDGLDQQPPHLPGVQVLVKEHGGPGAARNEAARVTERPLVLFLGDDMIPTPRLVELHLDGHQRHQEETSAVLGHVRWHPEVDGTGLQRWMDWSGAQFDYHNITGADAGWGRFYSCNVSLKRAFFRSVGGFDEDFTFDYEDLDIAWRLHRAGLQLWYEPGAQAQHLHPYDWDRLLTRYESRARGERLMQAKHHWFEPWFESRIRFHASQRRVSGAWPAVVERLPERVPARVLAAVRRRADRWYQQQIAPRFLAVWDGEPDHAELREYLGADFDPGLLVNHVAAVESEERAASDEATFYRTSRMYLYDLTAFAMAGTKRPYFTALRPHLRPGARVLDYGCGIGSDGLRLLAEGVDVSFADFDNPSTDYLRWRLAQRGASAPVYDLDREVPGGFDVAYCLDVIEHVSDPFSFLIDLERRASIIMVNFLEEDREDTDLHKPLPIDALLDHCASGELLHYRRYHERSHLVIYRPVSARGLRRVRSLLQRRVGPSLPTPV